MTRTHTALAACLSLVLVTAPLAAFASQSTPDARPAVVEKQAPQSDDKTGSEFSIWVGEVELRGRKMIWVELIDRHGEVVYDSEIRPNETHLLPNGRAIVIRDDSDDSNLIAKKITDRVIQEDHLIVTRRVVTGNDGKTTVEFIEEDEPKKPDNPLVAFAKAGEWMWSKVVAFFSATVETVRVAWTAISNVIGA